MSSNLTPKGSLENYSIPTSAYIHIPFCRRRCFYCDFPIYVVGDRRHGNNSASISRYVDVLIQEITITESYCQPLKTIFFGGGTPSLLSVGQLQRILEAVDRRFGIGTDAEISLEMDPGTFDWEKLWGCRSLGINRVSLGVQAFDDQLLKVCGRSHQVADIYEAIDLLQKAEIVNISIDLISGLPDQTMQLWQASLEAAIALTPTHISSYDLIVEPGTAFARYYQPGKQPLPADETAAEMYRMAQQLLTAVGYEHYEISNYALPGYQCRHNRVYWENRPYYAWGMGAASYLGEYRLTRPRKTQEYYEWVRSLGDFRLETRASSSGNNYRQTVLLDEGNPTQPPLERGEDLRNPTQPPLEKDLGNPPQPPLEREENLVNSSFSKKGEFNDVLLETVMLGLRLAEGLSLEMLHQKFGPEKVGQIWQSLQSYRQSGWVEVLNWEGKAIPLERIEKLPVEGRLRLTAPEGFLFSNTVLATVFSQLLQF